MTGLDTIRMIGDVITKIDVMRGSLLPNDPQRHDLDDARILLDDKQKRLSRAVFDDTTQAFKDGAAKLAVINGQIQDSLDNLDSLMNTLQLIESFTNAVTTLLSAVAPFA
jgi:hypothetical protein